MIEVLKIDRYAAEIENGVIVYYAIHGKRKIRMPDAFRAMYNDAYLRIRHVAPEFPELFGESGDYWIPIRTAEGE